ncbi:MAG: flagellar basal body P-ring protein FlgI [Candidatus Omnitrophica bacterium]|nr:Flagellar P-ring protein [bacterium]NUN96940.1 flagellar basal body P-ring protein FlgI [Candidatus Omnitrophota bacterium]
MPTSPMLTILKWFAGFLIFAGGLILGSISEAAQVRVKDIARVELERGNQLMGYGLVVGLNGTGDDSTNAESARAIRNYLALLSRQGRGLDIDFSRAEAKNSALVVVTAELPPYVRAGARLDITISSQFDAKSLVGGTLLATPLFGMDGKIYAVAQGPVSVGGFSQGGAGGGAQKNHPTVGTIANGALVEENANFLREHDRARLNSGRVNLILKNPDYIQARNLQKSINESFSLVKAARALDPGTVEVDLSMLMARYEYSTPMEVISEIEELTLQTDLPARVVVSERTGVVIAGGEAKLSAVEIVQGELRIVVEPGVPEEVHIQAQPPVVDPTGAMVQPPTQQVQRVGARPGRTQVVEGDKTLVQLKEGDTVGNMIRAISASEVGASPRDIIAILQALDRMGALHAQLIFVED